MELTSIGAHIKKARLSKSWKQDELAEKTDLSIAYIGMIERGEKIPKLETFIRIINVLGVSADEMLEEVINTGYKVRMSKYIDKLDKLSGEDRRKILDIMEIMMSQGK